MPSLSSDGSNASDLGLSFDAAGAGLDALAVGFAGPLQIRLQAPDRSAHAVRAFYSAGIGFAADSTHSRHKRDFS